MIKSLNKNKIKFPKPKSVGKRPWGKEILLVLIPKVLTLKLLKIKKGFKGGLQYHRRKNECGYLLSGKLILRYVDKKGKIISKTLKKDSSFHIPPGAIHQEEAISDCQIIEASSPHFNDRVRVEKFFGLKEIKGLPSTKLTDVKKL